MHDGWYIVRQIGKSDAHWNWKFHLVITNRDVTAQSWVQHMQSIGYDYKPVLVLAAEEIPLAGLYTIEKALLDYKPLGAADDGDLAALTFLKMLRNFLDRVEEDVKHGSVRQGGEARQRDGGGAPQQAGGGGNPEV